MRSTVKQHKRKVKNKVVTVTRHARGKYGKKPKNDKYHLEITLVLTLPHAGTLKSIKRNLLSYSMDN
jgi:hypothetical protein